MECKKNISDQGNANAEDENIPSDIRADSFHIFIT